MDAISQIRRAYENLATQNGRGWFLISTIAERVDLTFDQLKQAITEASRYDMDLQVMPESNQKTLSDLDHTLAVYVGGDWNHLIKWER